ncbi:phosphonate ABC transporter ATP-binding protein [Williamsia sp. CHRR-6]|uniref:phosphonate ABC transporter ATP-binding protein n=1 Tax=Williamsia sp. CHRR-6 TaxID=2835871 RepID=UPI001BDAA2E6|nr:phosphonate ABC transporter ATP-binding protein [Williamsia sp. CHRR-6]MBT0566451.1 phosphonate ABC transporter ATP-binding protein [Williamsia sp. CHRR-6]
MATSTDPARPDLTASVVPADIELDDVSVTYPNGHQALSHVSLRIPAGQMVAVVGLSGAGKSTLIRVLNGLVPITSGAITVAGRRVDQLGSSGLRDLRSQIGMIFQGFNLSERSTVIDNVLMGRLHSTPLWRSLTGSFAAADVELAMQALERVGIVEKAYQRASSLSGGQKQRVAIARALAQQPRVMLADEPVASLDPPTSHTVMRDLRRINTDLSITVIVNLHFLDLAREYGSRLIGLRGGEVVFDGTGADADETVFERIYGRSLTGDDVLEARAQL